MRRAFFVFSLGIALCGTVEAQLVIQPTFQHIPAEKFGVDMCVRQVFTSDGALWCMTETEGMLRYDGYSTQRFKRKPGNKNSLLSDTTLAFYYHEKRNEFWIGYYGKPGISRFDVKTKKFTHYLPDSTRTDALPEVQIVTFKEDSQGNFWLLTWGMGLVKMDRQKGSFQTLKRTPTNAGDPTVPAANQVKGFVEWQNGKYVVGYFGGEYSSWPSIYDSKTQKFTPFPVEEYLKKSDPQEAERIRGYLNIINNVHVDRNKNIWFCSYSGLVFFDVKNKEAYRVSAKKIDPSIGNLENTRGVIEDDRGRLWVITTFNGFLVIDPDKPRVAYNVAAQMRNASALQHNSIYGLRRDLDGNIWISTGAGGFTIYDPLLQEFELFPWDEMNLEMVDASSQAMAVQDMHVNRDGKVFIAHGKGIQIFDPELNASVGEIKAKFNTHLPKTDVTRERIYTFRIEGDNVWITNIGQIEVLNLKTGKQQKLKGEYSRMPHFRNSGNNGPVLFRGNLYNTLLQVNPTSNELEEYFSFPDTVGTSGGYGYVLKTGKWLLASSNTGFIVFDPETKKWDRYSSGRNRTKWFPDSTGITSVTPDPTGMAWVCTQNGVYTFHEQTGRAVYMNTKMGLKFGEPVMCMAVDKNGIYWIALNKELMRFNPKTGEHIRFGARLGLKVGSFLSYIPEQDDKGKIYFSTEKGLLVIDPMRIKVPSRKPNVFLSALVVGDDTLSERARADFLTGETKLNWDENFITLDFCTDQLYTPSPHHFYYRLIGIDSAWQDNGISNRIRYTNLSHGKYKLEIKIVNAYNVSSPVLRIPFTIRTPFWLSWWFLILVLLGVTGIVFVVIRIRERAHRKREELLEAKIEERTAEVVAKAREIQMQKDIIEEKNKELTDSIHYAQRIQQSILPDETIISKNLPEHFIFFRPKDIVSGDFYWFSKQKDSILWAVVDCTGHGVPGGFMSMLGSGLLNQIVNEEQKLEPDEILNNLRDRVMIALRQTGAEGESRDGMDISLCRYIISQNKLQYAGANNSLYMIRNNELTEMKADKQPIGIYIGDKKPFTKREMTLAKGDLLYMSSDGYADQFGGVKGKKFKSSSFEKLLTHICPFGIREQHNAIEETFVSWKGDYEQLDDVCVIGVRV